MEHCATYDCHRFSFKCYEFKKILNMCISQFQLYERLLCTELTFNGSTCYIKWNAHCDVLLVLMIILVLEFSVYVPAVST